MDDELLKGITSPTDLKNLSLTHLIQLAGEIRHRIIEVMSVNGGHLASNLGSIELTIALHKVFNAPDDKLVFDVSHQTYAHKLLTGRQELFALIRQYKGLCGFAHPKESPFDHFYAGHAGTALSLALGLVKSRDLNKKENYVIPIIGDATLTCGMTLEALNNVSRELKRFIIILNDNAMSISQNVGAITRILSRILSNPTTHKLHQEIDTLVSKIPSVGPMLSKQGHKITESLKNLVSPSVFFEQFGLSYIGPIDGHDIKVLIDTFEGIKDSHWPVVVHVHTNKGQGMEMAIQNPVTYHGAKPFNRDTGKFLPVAISKPTFPKIFGSHVLAMAKKDPHIIAVTPAMSCGSSLDEFMKEYPDRCIDVGIAEGHAVTFAGGIAYGHKMKVFVSIYSTFLQRAFDNLFHDVCLQEIPIVFAIDRAGIAGPDGSTHNGIYDISFLNAMPNMIISQPRNGHVLKELMESAFTWGRPAAIRYPNMTTEESDLPLKVREFGKGELLAEGDDLLIIALGTMTNVAFELKEMLLQKGINCAILDPVFVKPLDAELLFKLLSTHHRIVTIEEHSQISGLGAILNHFFMSHGYSDLQVLNIGIPEGFIEQGTHKQLMHELGITAEKIFPRILHRFHLTDLSPSQSIKMKAL